MCRGLFLEYKAPCYLSITTPCPGVGSFLGPKHTGIQACLGPIFTDVSSQWPLFQVCLAQRGPEDWSTLSLLFPGKLSLDEGGSDTESLYEIEGLNKIIQFV